MSIDSQIDKISRKTYFVNYDNKAIRKVTPEEFIFEVSPTLFDGEYDEETRQKWNYVLYHNNGEQVKVGEGFYPHSKWNFVEKANIKEAMKERLGVELDPRLLENIVDIHFLKREGRKRIGFIKGNLIKLSSIIYS